MTYSEKLRDPRWIALRVEVLERDEHKCRDCESDSGVLEVHHCAYAASNPWETPAELLLTLCRDCHWNRQGTEDQARIALGYLFARSTEPEARRFMKQIQKEAQVTIEMGTTGREFKIHY